MDEVVFHIGIPKTGSSAIQVFFARNRDIFLSNSIDYLPIGEFSLGAAGKISSGNGAFLARSIFPNTSPIRIAEGQAYVDQFLAAVNSSNAATGLVSSELFTDVDQIKFAELIAELRSRGIVPRCFYFIRSQIPFLSSAYIQQVKRHGCLELPDEFVSRSYQSISYLKYYTLYRRVVDVFGDGSVICRSYDAATTAPHGLFNSLLAALAMSVTGLSYEVGDVNTGISSNEIAIMLILNRFGPRMKFSDMVVKNAIKTGSSTSGQVHNILSVNLKDNIQSYFRTENSQLARDYFNRNELFPATESFREPVPISIDYLSPTDIVSFFSGLLVEMDNRMSLLEERLSR